MPRDGHPVPGRPPRGGPGEADRRPRPGVPPPTGRGGAGNGNGNGGRGNGAGHGPGDYVAGLRSATRWVGRLSTLISFLVLAGAALVGIVLTLLAGQRPGVLLGIFITAGALAAVLGIHRASAYLLFPLPVIAFFLGALITGLVHDSQLVSADTAAFGTSFLQWVSAVFVPMVIATIVVVVIGGGRWLFGSQLITRRAPEAAGRTGGARPGGRRPSPGGSWTADDPLGGRNVGTGPVPRATGTGPAPRPEGTGPTPRIGGNGPVPRSGATGPTPRQGTGPTPRQGTGPVPRPDNTPRPGAGRGRPGRDPRTDRDPWGDPRLPPDRSQPPADPRQRPAGPAAPQPRDGRQPRDGQAPARGPRPSWNPAARPQGRPQPPENRYPR